MLVIQHILILFDKDTFLYIFYVKSVTFDHESFRFSCSRSTSYPNIFTLHTVVIELINVAEPLIFYLFVKSSMLLFLVSPKVTAENPFRLHSWG